MSARTHLQAFFIGGYVPYRILGNKVVKKDTGKVVGHSKNPKKYLRTLQAIEHGAILGKKK